MTAASTAADRPKTGSLLSYAPLLLFIFALMLRVWGISWALPDANRAYSYHPDESVVVGHALDLDPLAGKLDPNFYNYGSLSLLSDSAAIHIFRIVGHLPQSPPELRPGGLALPTASELLVARAISVLLGAGTAVFIFQTGRLLYGQIPGIIAGAAYAVAPLAVQHAHFATVDIPGTFWIAGSLYFAARHLRAEKARVTDLLWCGIWAGLAGAAKYNGVLVVLAGAAAWWLVQPRRPIPLALLAGGTILGFVVGCPGILLNPHAVIRDALFEAHHVATGHGDVFVDTTPGFIYHIVFNLHYALTLPLLLVCLAGVGVAAVRRRPADGLLAAFALPYYILIGLAQVKFARYTLPLFPPLMLLAGAAWEGWRNPKAELLLRVGTAFACVGALGFSLALDQCMNEPDPRDEAAAYLKSLPDVHTVGFAAGPWYFSPTLGPLLAHPFPPIAQRSTAADGSTIQLIPSLTTVEDPARGIAPDSPVEWYTPLIDGTDAPDAITFGEIHYADWLRTHHADAETYLLDAEKRYPTHKDFTKPIALFGLPLVPIRTVSGTPWHGLPTQSLPQDMLYTNQSVSVWTK